MRTRTDQSMVEKVADAVLYEGYILYPYRPSLKNRQRWTFGGVFPQAYVDQRGGEVCSIQTECLLDAAADATVDVRVRFLHLIERDVAEVSPPLSDWSEDREPPYRLVDRLGVGDETYHRWQEAAERDVRLGQLPLQDLSRTPRRQKFYFPAARWLEPIRVRYSHVVGLLIRQQRELAGSIDISATLLKDRLYKLTVVVRNSSPLPEKENVGRDEAQLQSLASTHTILALSGGAFFSMTEPPDHLRGAAESCRNQGAWPVLVGEEGARDTILSAPIILYDYPQIAPESPGDLFDATEIDEILTLRLLTLTDDERSQVASVEQTAQALLQRTESLGPDTLAGLHGTLRKVSENARGASS